MIKKDIIRKIAVRTKAPEIASIPSTDLHIQFNRCCIPRRITTKHIIENIIIFY